MVWASLWLKPSPARTGRWDIYLGQQSPNRGSASKHPRPARPRGVSTDGSLIPSSLIAQLEGVNPARPATALNRRLDPVTQHIEVPDAEPQGPWFRGSIFERNDGWDGRIRTYGTLYQKQLPYHLATSQRCEGASTQSLWRVQEHPRREFAKNPHVSRRKRNINRPVRVPGQSSNRKRLTRPARACAARIKSTVRGRWLGW